MESAALDFKTIEHKACNTTEGKASEIAEVRSKKAVYRFIKRSFDIVVSVIGLTVLGLPMLFVALLIRLDSPGPAIFRQERLGKDGKPFVMYKFRTMGLDAEANGPQWAEENDWRCTRVGRLLRLSRIDELPQLMNVVKGEMSLVGPRPERKCFYERFETYIHGFSDRLAAVPGITGWAQVNGGYSLLPEEKLVYDMEYIRNCSPWMDAKCIFLTISVVFTHKGAR